MYDYFQLDRAKESINFLVDEDEEDNDDVFSDIDDNTNNSNNLTRRKRGSFVELGEERE